MRWTMLPPILPSPTNPIWLISTSDPIHPSRWLPLPAGIWFHRSAPSLRGNVHQSRNDSPSRAPAGRTILKHQESPSMSPDTSTRPDRNLALELVRVTEFAALAAAPLVGMGDKEAADQAAVDGMRYALHSIAMDGTVVIGEGEKDEAPMLYNGERIGDRSPPEADSAVDPL